LRDAMKVLEGIPDIAICNLTSADVVRHELVSKIIEAYEKREKKTRGPTKPPTQPAKSKTGRKQQ